jgi:hypothetical protein
VCALLQAVFIWRPAKDLVTFQLLTFGLLAVKGFVQDRFYCMERMTFVATHNPKQKTEST